MQLRLRQIVDAPPGEKEALLKDLEEFAFRGIPEVHCDLSKNLMLNSVSIILQGNIFDYNYVTHFEEQSPRLIEVVILVVYS